MSVAESGIIEAIRAHYAHVAKTRLEARPAEACCSPSSGSPCCGEKADATATTYTAAELESLPRGAFLRLGTGAPVRHAKPQPGETVLDLGSGAGVDVFLASREVGPTGRAIGVDFTPDMVSRARRNAEAGGFTNVEFFEAPIERLPLRDASVDVVVSNCVVNLSPDKASVLAEARRVLRPGGRFVVSDTIRLAPGSPSAAPSCDCTTGALSIPDWRRMLAAAGFADVSILLEDGGESCCGGSDGLGRGIVRATRP